MLEPTTTASLVAAAISALAVLLGFVTSSVTDYLKDSRAQIRERKAREATRRNQIADRRIGFQRETLVSLQEAVLEEARSAGQISVADEKEFRKSGKWGQPLPEDLSDNARLTTVKTLMLSERVRDKETRELIAEFRKHTNQVGITPSLEQERQALSNMSDVLTQLHPRIGIVLRQLDDDEDSETEKRKV
jgi:hypothetical protein